MKAKLLKRLRKQAHDAYRICPEMMLDECYHIEKQTANGWCCLSQHEKLTFERAVLLIEAFRHGRFVTVAEELIAKRRYKERLKKVNEYENTI